ncbi:alpha/beta hydrolase [Candidatus Solincola tengchongensis]|uniref:alpha/beta hydrolase n=1 Tax=Candidatus Solincola tengchongensis TaxID=2900693 RepID=UPI00257E7A62|nr:alpha/beta hydrolase [Candidatus Solincola tengchongensis]
MKKGCPLCFTLLIVLILALYVLPYSAADVPPENDRYAARTADGVELALKRYRPDPGAPFRKGRQPVILMPGLMSNMNEFDVHTPPGESFAVILPSTLAPWARDDPYVARDPMRYYSLAHYLWNQGYDVWLANYRGEGRGPYVSGGQGGYSLDDLGIYDVPAVVKKVYEETGRHPVYIGHSMGASMAYIFLEGAEYLDAPDPHVHSDPALVKERNSGRGEQSLKGLVVLDGPMGTVGMNASYDPSLFLVLRDRWYMDLRWLNPVLDLLAPCTYQLYRFLWFLCRLFNWPDLGPMNLLLSTNPDNIHQEVHRYLLKHAVDGMSTRTVAQFSSAYATKRFREDWYNGVDDSTVPIPPPPAPGDGYYYYSDHLDLVSLPVLVIADDTVDITHPDDIRNFFLGKSRHRLDYFLRVPNTAHVDLVAGLNAPTEVFPAIGRWLRMLCRSR